MALRGQRRRRVGVRVCFYLRGDFRKEGKCVCGWCEEVNLQSRGPMGFGRDGSGGLALSIFSIYFLLSIVSCLLRYCRTYFPAAVAEALKAAKVFGHRSRNVAAYLLGLC